MERQSHPEANQLRAWTFSSTAGGVENNLHLTTQPFPKHFTHLAHGTTLIRVLNASLNPIDVKVAEIPYIGRLIQRLPAVPGLDCSGIVERTTDPTLRQGQLVSARIKEFNGYGSLGSHVVASCVVPVPAGIMSHAEAAALPTCGMTALQCLLPFAAGGGSGSDGKINTNNNNKKKKRVFINGGSGGVGTFQIQVAKLLGFEVVTTCSAPNIALCQSLGADEVLDYRAVDVPAELSRRVRTGEMEPFDLVIGNVDRPWKIYKAADAFVRPGGHFVQIGGGITLADVGDFLRIYCTPRVLGGGRHKFEFRAVKSDKRDMAQLVEWVGQGKLKVVIDEEFAFEDAPRAYAKLKTHRAKGKLVVKVAD